MECIQRAAQRVAVAFAKPSQSRARTSADSAANNPCLALGVFSACIRPGAQQVHGHGRNDGARPHVGSQHRENHRFRQRHEQKFRHARKKKHRDEHDADTQSGNKRRYSDLLRAVQNGLHRFLTHRQIAVDIFDFHRGVIDQNAHGQRQSAQRHDVDGFAQRAEAQRR